MTEDDKKAAQYRKEAMIGGTDASVPDSVTQEYRDKRAALQAEKAPTPKSTMGDSLMKFGLEMMKNSKPSNVESKAKGGKISSASSRADGIAQRGKTKGTMVMCGGGMYKK
jgi:hypothetical protein